MSLHNDPTRNRAGAEAEGGTAELESIFGKYSPTPRNLALLTLHLYEVFKGCNHYLKAYRAILAAPRDPGTEREQLAETLTDIKVRLNDLVLYARDLKKEIDKFLDHLDKDS